MALSTQELRKLWGPVGQIGYIVHDLESSAQQWTQSIGIGPWQIFNPAPFDAISYRGQPADIEAGFALAFMGQVQIELIQQHNAAPSMYRDILDTYGEGAQHICFYPEDYDAALAAGLDAGMQVAQSGEIWGIDFAYLLGDGGRVIELARLSDERRTYRGAAIAAAGEWDGTDPLRRH